MSFHTAANICILSYKSSNSGLAKEGGYTKIFHALNVSRVGFKPGSKSNGSLLKFVKTAVLDRPATMAGAYINLCQLHCSQIKGIRISKLSNDRLLLHF